MDKIAVIVTGYHKAQDKYIQNIDGSDILQLC